MSDEDWTPELKEGLDWTKLSLSPEEGFVLSRIDGATSVKNLEHLTGLPKARVVEIVSKLVDEGAIGGSPSRAAVPAPVSLGPAAAPRQPETVEDALDDEEPVHPDARETAEAEDQEALDVLRAEQALHEAEVLDGEALDEDGEEREDAELDELLHEELDEEELEAAREALEDAELLEGDEEDALNQDEDFDEDAHEDDDASDENDQEDDDDDDDDDDLVAAAEQASYRKLYETELRALERDQRIKLASEAEDETLCALCFDADPAVIRAVLENLKTGLKHARLIAAHHRNGVGLDALSRRAELMRDGQVQRLLLRNNQTSDPLLRRLMGHKPLSQLFQLCRGRELTERAKRMARQELRRAFQQASADERVALIFTTEGRCLPMLVGLSFDGKTTALLCGRTYVSALLIQNVLRFSATPPPVLVHLAKQSSVRRSPSLKALILQHPNCPTQLKRA